MDSNTANCGWCWGNHAGNIFIDDAQICQLGKENNPLPNPSLNPISTPTPPAPQNTSNLTFGAIDGGSVTLGWTGNDTVLVSSNGSYTISPGENLTIVAYPDNGMRLARWRLNGETVTNNPHTLTINTETTVNVTFEPVVGAVSPLTIYLILILEMTGGAMAVLGAIQAQGYKIEISQKMFSCALLQKFRVCCRY